VAATSCSAGLKSAAAATLISRSADTARGIETPESKARNAIKVNETIRRINVDHLESLAIEYENPLEIVQAQRSILRIRAKSVAIRGRLKTH